jgi:hypothetical protein
MPSEANAVVVMSNGDKIESPEALADLVERFTRARDALMDVADINDEVHHVNLAHVVEVRAPHGSGATFA